MIDQSLPFAGEGEREWRLWLELWGHAARRPELRAFAAQLYERYDAWIAEVVRGGDGERRVRAPVTRGDVTQRLVAMIDGVGLRVLVAGDRLPLERGTPARGARAGRGARRGRGGVRPEGGT